MSDDIVPLVMMTEDHNARPEFPPCRLDPLVDLRIGHNEVIFQHTDRFQNSTHG
jgi:hypothetical protein